MDRETARMTYGGRIVIPAHFRKALGVREGDELLISREDDRLILTSRSAALKRAQALAKKFRTERSPADELIEQRRREAAGD